MTTHAARAAVTRLLRPARPVILGGMAILLALVAAAVAIGGGVLVLILFLVRRPPRRHGPEADYDDTPRRPSP